MTRKPEELYIFTTSPRADPYVNILVQASKQFSLKRIHFINIVEHGYQAEVGNEEANATMTGALDALRALAAGTYRDGDHTEPIGDANVAIYRQCVERLNYMQVSAQGIRWSDLDAELRLFDRAESTLFDVTALKKNLLVDVVVLLLSQGEPQIWTFELIKKPTYDKDDLIHAMTEGQDYKYYCITDGKHVEMATKRMLARSFTFRTLLFITGAILVPVALVEIFLPNSWIQSALVGVGTAVSIAGWFLVMRRQ